jgi:mRNA-degrading endonuclease RelE of RelBE toxin-antitoxin system
MSCNIVVTEGFKREAKKLFKKFPSLKEDLRLLSELLTENPAMGVKLTNNVYKIRLAVKSKGKGKRGGMRVITYLWEQAMPKENEFAEATVFLLSIYDKSEEDNITDRELGNLIREIEDNLPQKNVD